MSRFDGVSPQSVDCPTCGQRKPFLCFRKATKKDVVPGLIAVGDWVGASKRSHPERVTAAQRAKIKGGGNG